MTDHHDREDALREAASALHKLRFELRRAATEGSRLDQFKLMYTDVMQMMQLHHDARGVLAAWLCREFREGLDLDEFHQELVQDRDLPRAVMWPDEIREEMAWLESEAWVEEWTR